MTRSNFDYIDETPYTLDYIFFGGNMNAVEIKNYYIIEDDLTLRASDHCPTVTDIILK
jgi:hypothetical protein